VDDEKRFLKDTQTGDLLAVVMRDGHILEALNVNAAAACRHRLDEIFATADDAAFIKGEPLKLVKADRAHGRLELFEPRCSDPTHLLADIAAANKECRQREVEYTGLHQRAQAAKKTYEAAVDALRKLVRKSTEPADLPLFMGTQTAPEAPAQAQTATV
jgi:hypothetical protein